MKKLDLRQLVFLALCCDMGLFCKKLISPAANVITGALHIPGGISTAFSLMFLTVAALWVDRPGCAAVMGSVQSVLALSFGMVGSMGILAPIGYIMPGIAIDLAGALSRHAHMSTADRAVLMNAAAAVTASLSANWIVFRLRGPILLLYLCVSCTCGALCGVLAGRVTVRAKHAVSL